MDAPRTELAIIETQEEAQASGVSWGAIAAGGIATSALSLLLLALGA
jgi:hypothetical protein